jgi:phospholipid/cholesterol/gamma-HCH transport system substrate-binding protein
MLGRAVRIQVAVFVVVALLGIGYVGVAYLGAPQWFGSGAYTVHLDLAQTGGIYTNAAVSYRGVQVGKVGDIRLTATGVQADLDITSSTPLPADSHATVADGSVIGEQYVDLTATHANGPFLHAGSTIPRDRTTLPPPVQDLLSSSEGLFASVPITSLRTVVDQLYTATDGAGPDLQQLIASSDSLFTTASGDIDNTTSLIDNARTVLATQQAESGQISQFSTNLALIGAQLKDSDGDVSRVLADTAPAADQVSALVSSLNSAGTLTTLLTSLLTTSTVFEQGQDGLRTVLVQLPVDVSIGNAVIEPQGVNVGLVPTFFDPLPCTTGYAGTTKRPGSKTTSGPPLNTAAGCTAPSSTGQDERGTGHAP